MRWSRTIAGALAAASLLCGGSGCARPRYAHAVFFTCKPDTPRERIEAMIADSINELPRIPSVRGVRCGTRDAEMDRSVNVTDFDVGLIVQFDDRGGYEAYREHPIHLEHVRRYGDMVAAMRVFDFSVE